MRVLLMLLGALTGCYATWDLPHRELAKLDGYRAPKTVVLKSTSDEDVTFGPNTHLIVDERDVRVASASVANGSLVVVTPAPNATTFRVRLAREGSVIVGQPSRFFTVTGAVVIGLAAAGLFMLVVDPSIPIGTRSTTH